MTERLKREVGLAGAVLLGLGSILGTGVFVSIAIAAGIAGPAVIIATAGAALVATCNALSSAQLAAVYPVSGGTYEYGHRVLSPRLGFIAGWMFLWAKSASAATAALGLSGYLLHATGIDGGYAARVGLAALAAAAITLLVVGGIRRSSTANAIIVSVTLVALCAFVGAGLAPALDASGQHLVPLFASDLSARDLLSATALMFVAYAGYGRIATLGEEVKDPRKIIPRAIVATLVVSMIVYVGVAFVAVAAAGAPTFAAAARGPAAPLETIARGFGVPGLRWLVAAAAITAMAGVLLNLMLGLSRVLLAMARRQDMPGYFAKLATRKQTPARAVVAIGALCTSLVFLGEVKLTWSLSALAVLVYYAITNLAALMLPKSQRRYPRIIAALGLVACLALAVMVAPEAWAIGLAIIAAGLVWQTTARRLARRARRRGQ